MFNRLFFSLWYFGRPPWDSGISPPELLEFIREHKPGLAIDLGCGTGTNLITLAHAGWQVTGVDFASLAIQKARRKLDKAGVSADLYAADVAKFHTDAQFDLALDIGCFHGVTDRAAYLKNLMGLLTPGGYWLMYGFFKPASSNSGPGLEDADLNFIKDKMTRLWRRNGTDKHERPSAWFLFRKPISSER